MAKIIRKQQWEGSQRVAYEIRKTGKYIHLAVLTCEQGCCDIVYRLPLELEAELVAAYDSDEMPDWVFNNIDEFTPVVSRQMVY